MKPGFACWFNVGSGLEPDVAEILTTMGFQIASSPFEAPEDPVSMSGPPLCHIVVDSYLDEHIAGISQELCRTIRGVSIVVIDTGFCGKKSSGDKWHEQVTDRLGGATLTGVIPVSSLQPGLKSVLELLARLEMSRLELERKSLEIEVLESELAEKRLELEAVSALDKVTGLFNRHYFDENLKKEWRQAERESQWLGLLAVKTATSREGGADSEPEDHGLLRQMGMTLLQGVHRPVDIVAHRGGGYYMVLLPGGDRAGAREVALRLSASLAQLSKEMGHQDGVCLSSRIGGAVCKSGGGCSVEDLMALAEDGLRQTVPGGPPCVLTCR